MAAYLFVAPVFQRIDNMVSAAENLAQTFQAAGALQSGQLFLGRAVQCPPQCRRDGLVSLERAPQPSVVLFQNVDLDVDEKLNLVLDLAQPAVLVRDGLE